MTYHTVSLLMTLIGLCGNWNYGTRIFSLTSCHDFWYWLFYANHSCTMHCFTCINLQEDAKTYCKCWTNMWLYSRKNASYVSQLF